MLLNELLEIIPAINARLVPIRKNQSHCIVTNKFNTRDINQTLTYLKNCFLGRMTLNFCRW